MTSRRLALLTTVVTALSAPGGGGVLAAEPDQARLTINEDVYNVPLGKPFAVRIGGERVTLRIDPQSDRSFDEAGVSFRYPMALEPGEAAGGGEVTVWTLQGRSAAIMLQRYAPEIDHRSLREVLVENLVQTGGAALAEPQAVKLTGAERAYQGTQLRTKQPAKGKPDQGETPATEMVQNVFTFGNAEGVFALIVQDVREPGGKDSAEYTESLRLLGESLKTGDEPEPPKAETAPAERTDR